MYVTKKMPDGRPVRLTPHRFPDGYGLAFRENLDVSLIPGTATPQKTPQKSPQKTPGETTSDRPLRVESLDELKKLASSDLFLVPFSHPDWNRGEAAEYRLDSIDFDGAARN
ncbi:MAG: hypothetical protein NXI16_04825 [Alphaproteobacteria bacterium]|nr:hypothetical protein [Alphaproteobacteria bacterium]